MSTTPEEDGPTERQKFAASQALDRAIRTASLYEGKGELCDAALSDALTALSVVRGDRDTLRVDVRPVGLAVEGIETDDDGETRTAAFQIFRDGLRAIWIDAEVSAETFQSLINILADPFQRWGTADEGEEDEDETLTTERDEDTVTRLWEAELEGVHVRAVEAYSEREVTLGDERKSMAEWVEARLHHLRQPAALTLPSLLPHTVLPSRITQSSRRQRHDHRALESSDTSNDIPRRIIVLCALEEIEPAEHIDMLLLATLAALESGGWAMLSLSIEIAQACAAEALHEGLTTALAGTKQAAALDAAIGRLRAEDTAAMVAVLDALGVAVAERAAPLLQDFSRQPVVEALEASLDERGLPAAPLFVHALAGSVDEAAWAVQRLAQRHERETPDADATAMLREALNQGHPATRLLAFRALEGDTHPDTRAALLHTLASDDRGLVQHCMPQISALIADETSAPEATDAILMLVDTKSFWDRPAPVRRLLIGLLRDSIDPRGADWIAAFLAKKPSWFKRSALKAQQDFVSRVAGTAAQGEDS